LPAAPRLQTTDRHRQEIAESLRQRGFRVQAEVGLSDFTIDLVVGSAESPDQPVLAVLLDGPGWAARRTVGDRDGLPVEVLSKLMHWPAVERVWLPEWLADAGAVLDRLAAVIEAASVAPDATTQDADPAVQGLAPDAAQDADPAVESPAPAADLDPDPRTATHPTAPEAENDGAAAATSAGLPGESPFTPWHPGDLGMRDVLDGLPAAGAARRVSLALVDAVEAEGPIELDRLVRLVAAGFGLHRVLAARHTAILAQLPDGLIADPSAPDFAWPASLDPLTWRGFRRTPDGVERPLEQISPREIGNAMVALCAAAAGMTTDQLWAGTLEVFGFTRRSAAQIARLEAALDVVLDSGRLSRRSDGVLIA
jgi:hypothetical protein